MKRKLVICFILCIVAGTLIGNSTEKEIASWAGPEPSGVVAVFK